MRLRFPAAIAAALAAALAVALAGCGGPASRGDAGPATVRIAAASDLQFALADVQAALAEAAPPVDLLVTYGSSGTFFQQISNGAPFDVYLSADLSYPQRLVEAGLAAPEDLFRYAVGRLVVWAPHGSPADVSRGLAGLIDPAITRIAIANPEHAPYGQAAVAAMTSAGVYEQVRDNVVLGENVSQAAEFAASGHAQAAVIALSLVLETPLADRGSYDEVPLDTFPRLDQGGVVLASAADPAAANRVRYFLTGPEGVAILARYGFFLPDR
jgi:molybdate transport system substrate-binding protein